jgi:hypothetical protein
MDAVDGADCHARLVQNVDARLGDHVGHLRVLLRLSGRIPAGRVATGAGDSRARGGYHRRRRATGPSAIQRDVAITFIRLPSQRPIVNVAAVFLALFSLLPLYLAPKLTRDGGTPAGRA